MKKLSKETAFNLKTGFGTLISNRSCVEAGKSLPWWIAIILGLVGSFIPVIPVMTNIARTNGDSFISSTYNYSFDSKATAANIALKNNGVELVVNGDHLLTYKKDGTEVDLKEPTELIDPIVNKTTGEYDIRVLWLSDTQEKTVNQYYDEYTGTQFVSGTTNKKTGEEAEGTKFYTPTYIFYYKEGNALYLAKKDATTAANKFSGDFVYVKEGTELVSKLLTVEGFETPTDINAATRGYIEGVYKNYKSFYNDSYQNIKNRSLLYSTFIYWGIYLGLTLFLGLLIFLLTRGKRNFNNYLKWYQCLAISGWASFTPGLLAMIMGFLLTSYAIMFFILFMGIRIMWLSMKQLSPAYQAA